MKRRILVTLPVTSTVAGVATALMAAGTAWAFDREPPEAIVLAARTEAASAAQVDLSATRAAAGFEADRLLLPRCTRALTARGRRPPQPQGRQSMEVVCPIPLWRVFVPIVVESSRRVVVLAHAASAGTILGRNDLTYSESPSGIIANVSFRSAEDLIGARLLRSAAAGQVVVPGWIRHPPAVRKGQTVSVVARTGSITIRTRGIASADASIADHVRIRNPSSGREIDAIVSGVDSVEVSLD